MTSFYFHIAGFFFEVQNHTDHALVLETGFEDFLCPAPSKVDRILHVHAKAELTALNQKPIYQAHTGTQLLWQIFKDNHDKIFEVYHPSHGAIQQIAHYSPSTKEWHIDAVPFESEGEIVLNPLAYPLAPLIWYTLTTEENMLMIHSSGIHDGTTGRLFAGFSGVGKSTMAAIWEKSGAAVVNDDRIIVKKEANHTWRMYNTPMYYRAEPTDHQLNFIYLPFHSPTNTFEPLKGANALASLLAYTIHHGYDSAHILHHTGVANDLLKDLRIAKLGVVPDPNICAFIRHHEAK